MNETISAAVVLYNISCEFSVTCQALNSLRNESVNILVYDNSTSDYGNKEYCETHGWIYLGGKGNDGISKAYNSCIRELKNRGQGGFLCLLDDDTLINDAYFFALQNEVSQSESLLYVPVVLSKGKILSPCKITKCHQTIRFRNEAELIAYRGGKLTAVNSGMIVALSLFDEYQYDENIFLDGVDHKFIKDMKLMGHSFHIIPYKCNHDFSGDTIQSIEGAKHRFRIFAKDYGYILRNHSSVYWYLVGKRAFHLTVQYGTLFFLRVLFHYAHSHSK